MAHNGGRSQFNLGAVQHSSDYPFLNYMKAAQEWSYNNAVSPSVPLVELDSDGYPTEILGGTGGVFTVFELPAVTARATARYVIKWSGEGTLQLSGISSTTVSGSLSGADGRCVINITSITSPGLRITATTLGNHVHNVVFCHEDDEAALDAGGIFGVKFMERLAEGNFGVVRFLGWQGGFDGSNTSNITKWEHRKPTTHYTYMGYQFLPDLYGGSATNSGNDYTLDFDGFVLEDKATVHLKFGTTTPQTGSDSGVTVTISNASPAVVTWTSHALTANNSVWFTVSGGSLPTGLSANTIYFVKTVSDANNFTVSATRGGAEINTSSAGSGTFLGWPAVTIDIEGTGPIRLVAPNAMAIGTSLPQFSHFSTQFPRTNRYATLVYDATIDRYIQYGGNLDPGNFGIMNGCPPEIMLELAAQIGAHPFFVAPATVMEPLTDYMTSLASLCKSRQDDDVPWMVPRFEPPNETWNTISAFHSTPYARAVAKVLWGVNDDQHNAYGKWCSVLGQGINAVYGEFGRYQVLCSYQTATHTNPSVARIESTRYVANDAGDPAYEWVTHICWANYWGQGLNNTEELQKATDYDALSTEEEEEDFLAAYIDEKGATIINSLNTIATNFKNFADGYDLAVTCYEGGLGTDNFTSNTRSTITAATKAAQCELTVAATDPNGNSVAFPPIGSSVTISSVSGMTELNGNTYTVVSYNSSTRKIVIDVNSTGFTTYTSGGTCTYVNSMNLRNQWRDDVHDAPGLDNVAFLLMNRLWARGVEMPSIFVIPGTGDWSKIRPNIYAATPTPEWDGYVQWNTSATPIRFTVTLA